VTAPTVFISYSHVDEWLKDELISHLSALKRSGSVEIWHDRCVPAGGMLNEEIDSQVNTADLFLFLISPAFIASDYCFHREYEVARLRQQRGEAEVIPVIVRDCDWDVGSLRSYNALPRDGVAVTRNATERGETQQRDSAWVGVIQGLRTTLEALKKKAAPPSLTDDYIDELFTIDFIRHPAIARFDERLIFVDPDVYYENEKVQLTSFQDFAETIFSNQVAVVVGGDRSGKSVLAKKTQVYLDSREAPSILIRGKSIRNADIGRYVESAIKAQYGETSFHRSKMTIIIDDFDECTLPDRIKEKIVDRLSSEYARVVLFSFTGAPAVLFTPDNLPDPQVFNISQLADDKIYQLVVRWKSVGHPSGGMPDDREVLTDYEKLQLIFSQSDIEKSAYSAVTFLELLETASGGDLAVSSFASCYDVLLTNRLQKAGIDWKTFDESKNFLSYVAYRSYVESETKDISESFFNEALVRFESNYLSSKETLRKMALSSFMVQDDDGSYSFREEYLWYFLCARHVSRELVRDDKDAYLQFVSNCTSHIFQKKYANIAIFISYFSTDNAVVNSMLITLKGLFSKANTWKLSDEVRELMLGIASEERLIIYVRGDIEKNRLDILKDKINDIIGNAMEVVAQYTLPFLNPHIGDSELVEKIDQHEIDGDSYMRSVNALLRSHSVLGQILATRAGTFPAPVLLDCIANMVQASGRYAALNHAIATVLMHEDDLENRAEVDNAITGDQPVEEKLRKVRRIFAFWSVYLSQAGLARYLSNAHAIRALEKLVDDYEAEHVAPGEKIPFNYTSVLVIAKLYHTGKISRSDIEECIRKYGDKSAVMHLFRVAIHIYTYYMPLEIEEKQWLSAKLSIPVQHMEAQRFRASDIGRKIIQSTRRVLPDPKQD
jgi:hypothetical protein